MATHEGIYFNAITRKLRFIDVTGNMEANIDTREEAYIFNTKQAINIIHLANNGH